MVKKLNLKIQKSSVGILWLLLAVIFIVPVLANFGIVDITAQTASITTLLGSLFVLGEIGWFKAVRTKLNPVRIGGLAVGIIAGLGAVLQIFEIDALAFLDPIQGVLSILLIVYIVIVAFTN